MRRQWNRLPAAPRQPEGVQLADAVREIPSCCGELLSAAAQVRQIPSQESGRTLARPVRLFQVTGSNAASPSLRVRIYRIGASFGWRTQHAREAHMTCSKHFLGLSWEQHEWQRKVAQEESIEVQVTDMWGRPFDEGHVVCRTRYVCSDCGQVVDGPDCTCDPKRGACCASRLEYLSSHGDPNA